MDVPRSMDVFIPLLDKMWRVGGYEERYRYAQRYKEKLTQTVRHSEKR